MAIIPTPYTGKEKRYIVEQAYDVCGLNGFEFERTPEEMARGLQFLNDLMADWEEDGIALGYDQPEYGVGTLDSPSGIPDHAINCVVHELALKLAPGLGKALSPEAKASAMKAKTRLESRYATVPTIAAPAVPRGAGFKRRWRVYVDSNEG